VIIRSLKKDMEELQAWETRAAQLEKEIRKKIARRETVSKNVEVVHQEQLTFGQRVSDRLSDVAGSWTFIGFFALFLVLWIGINSVQLLLRPFDHYPYILLNLMLSCLAAIQAPVILMSQNRQEARDRIRAEHDYEVNLKAELEIEQLRQRLDQLADRQWQDVLVIQSQQIELLNQQIDLLRGKSSRESSTSDEA